MSTATGGETRIAHEIGRLKRINRYDQLCAAMLPCEGHDGYLLPVCDLHREDRALVEDFARWREENFFAFPSQFPVTIEGTTRWLQKGILDNPNRLLFLVLDRFGRPVGQVGITEYLNDRGEVEAENIVRGLKISAPGLMARAMRAMIAWTKALGGTHIHLRVFADNDHAVNFYRKLGFRDDHLLPLRKHVDGAAVVYKPLAEGDTAPPDKQFLGMVLG